MIWKEKYDFEYGDLQNSLSKIENYKKRNNNYTEINCKKNKK